MASEENFNSEISRSMAPVFGRKDDRLEPEMLDHTLHRVSPPRYASPERHRSPIPFAQVKSLSIDQEIELKRRLAYEDRHRMALEDHGCPPCCPSHVEFPYQSPLGEYEGIVNWWKSRGQPYILASQLENWEIFCEWRKNLRPQAFTEHELRMYTNEICARRHRFGLEGEINLELRIEDQSRSQNLIEYQDYHHQIHAHWEESKEEDVVENHKILLQWIEEQREKMAVEEAESELHRPTEDRIVEPRTETQLLSQEQPHSADSSSRDSEDSFDPEAFSYRVGRNLGRNAPPIDLDDLNRRLENASSPRWASPGRFVTPERLTPESQRTRIATPYNPEKLRLANVACENEARKALEESGCPPCCPIDIEYPYKKPLGKYKRIIKWWKIKSKFLLLGDSWVHEAHLRDWQKFCRWRSQRRPTRCTRQAFKKFLDEFRERRRAFGLEGEVHLEPEVEKQTRLQNWIEYQDFHHRQQARLEEKPYKDWVKRHKHVLPWIEEQRKIMFAEEAGSNLTGTQAEPASRHQTSKSQSRPAPGRTKTVAANSMMPDQEGPPKKRRRQPANEGADGGPEEEARPRKPRRTSKVSQVAKAKASKKADSAPRRNTRQLRKNSQTAVNAIEERTEKSATAGLTNNASRRNTRQLQQARAPAPTGPAKKAEESTASNAPTTTSSRKTRKAAQTAEPVRTESAKKTKETAASAASFSNFPTTTAKTTTSGRKPRTRLAQQPATAEPTPAPASNAPNARTKKTTTTRANANTTQLSAKSQPQKQEPLPTATRTTAPPRRGRKSKTRSIAAAAVAEAGPAQDGAAAAKTTRRSGRTGTRARAR
ncbi:uncharacterized protein IWZ02DRAFT_462339 [Phyllosticta citriasiana]|uniref:uncharacterized protein n=1 Tax=Phyllosticta citriasiana TaxID=595635 RepID=UPI0030FD72F7